MTIYLDMDGVLADFNKGYEYLAGYSPIFHHETMEVDWKLVDSFVGFFGALDPMPDAKMLVQYLCTSKAIMKEEHQIRVLTSLPYTQQNTVKREKKDWLDEKFPWLFVDFVEPMQKKADFAKPGDILIDDWPGKHQKAWVERGGRFIWHVKAHETIKTLRGWGL